MHIPTYIKRHIPYYQSLVQLGIPIMIGQLGIIIVGFTDNIMVGQHHTNELAAASFVNNLFNLAIIFGLGFSYGLTPIISALAAKNKLVDTGRYLRYSLLANALLSIILVAIMIVVYFNLPRMGQPEHLLPLIRPYFIIQLVGIIFVMLFNAFKQFFDGMMETHTPMYILLTSNALNIIGNYLLIYGVGIFPELGLVGAGISTLIARVFVLIASVIIFTTHPRYARVRQGFSIKKIEWARFKELVTISLPIACQMGMETAAFGLSVVMMGWIGTAALAAHQIVGTFTTIGFMLYYGIGAAITILASNKRGIGDIKSIPLVANAGFHLILGLAFITSVVMLLLRHHIALLFTDSVEVNLLVTALIIPTVLYQIGDGLQIAYANALRSLEDVTAMAIIAFISYFVVCLPTAYLFGFTYNGGAVGIWWGFPVGLTLAGVLFYSRFCYVIKKAYR